MGKIHSIETLSAVDGPGLRMVVFLQGCPLRCQYCHNPDTWDFAGGTETAASEIAAKAARCKRYFGAKGGVTFSGGEPLAQAEFVLDCIRLLHQSGIGCCVDTGGGVYSEAAKKVLDEADLILLDIKHSDPNKFCALTGHPMDALDAVLARLRLTRKPVWIRQVMVPGITLDAEQIRALKRKIEGIRAEKIELLPYHTLGVHKWAALGIPYPLEGTRLPTPEEMDAMYAILAE